MKSLLKWIIGTIFVFICGVILFIIVINVYIVSNYESYIISFGSDIQFDCILILGASVKPDGTPSLMLQDRLNIGIEAYQYEFASKLLMSGDHREKNYDEVNVMKQYAIDAGIPSTDIFMDHAGLNTYDSMYRAKEVFGVKTVLIITQEYHLYRALYIARSLGMDAYGVVAPGEHYVGQEARDVREVFARVKAFFSVLSKSEPAHLGEIIPIFGDGDQTNDL